MPNFSFTDKKRKGWGGRTEASIKKMYMMGSESRLGDY
jgi:hypothetical protein